MTIHTITHIALRVSDLGRSLAYYRDGLGFRETSRIEVEGGPSLQMLNAEGGLSAIFLERDGVRLELLKLILPRGPEMKPREQVGLGWGHIGFQVEDAETLASHLCELGGGVVESSRYAHPELGSKVLYVTDPDGAMIELIQLPGGMGEVFGS